MDIEHSDQDTHAWICSAFEDRFELISHNDSSLWSKASFDSVLHDFIDFYYRCKIWISSYQQNFGLLYQKVEPRL